MVSRVARFCLPDFQILGLPRPCNRVAARRYADPGCFWQTFYPFRFV